MLQSLKIMRIPFQYNILLQAICAEVDVVIKRLCYEYDSQAEVNDMYDYIQLITSHDSNFKDVKLDYSSMKWRLYLGRI